MKNDLMTARITVENLGIPPENVYEFVDKPLSDKIQLGDKTWSDLKELARLPGYEKQGWFVSISIRIFKSWAFQI